MCGLTSPSIELVRVFQDLDRNLVVIFESLSGRGREWLTSSGVVEGCSHLICFEVESALVNDAEEGVLSVQPVSTEHGAAGYAVQITELIHHEVLESVGLRCHGSLTEVCVPRPCGQQGER